MKLDDPEAYCRRVCLKMGFYLQTFYREDLVQMDCDFFQDDNKLQSAWGYWEINAGGKIVGTAMLDSDLYQVIEYSDGVYLQKTSLRPENVDATAEFEVLLDRKTTEASCLQRTLCTFCLLLRCSLSFLQLPHIYLCNLIGACDLRQFSVATYLLLAHCFALVFRRPRCSCLQQVKLVLLLRHHVGERNLVASFLLCGRGLHDAQASLRYAKNNWDDD